MIREFSKLKPFLPKGKGEENTFKVEVIKDLWVCLVSREASLTARREVLTGKAKFGVTGDGKELAQLTLSRAFKKGDFFAPYYRAQTFMFNKGLSSLDDYFAQLYADSVNDPFSNGRQMNNHFATQFIDENGDFLDLANKYNVTAGMSPTAGSTGKSIGLALASQKFKETDSIQHLTSLSNSGQEVCFSTIGDGSTSEGVFWETMNAACVLKVPLITVVMDDGFGISVPVHLQTTKASISDALQGFTFENERGGMIIEKVNGWDYPALCAVFDKVTHAVRKNHIPALIHITELTQPQGHSTSGSHERYKTKQRLEWEKEFDCNKKFVNWILANDLLDEIAVENLRRLAKDYVKEKRSQSWHKSRKPVQEVLLKANGVYEYLAEQSIISEHIESLLKEAQDFVNPYMSEIIQNLRRLSIELNKEQNSKSGLIDIVNEVTAQKLDQLGTRLYSSSPKSALKVPVVNPIYSEDSSSLVGFKILNTFFRKAFKSYPNTFAFGEDVGMIGDVNQGFSGMQSEFGEERVFDCGIREWTIMGQAIGMAMRGLRPIAEIQYLDYIFYALAILTDDLSTLRYRSYGLQSAPVIIRTRGHRLEGIWHTGSHMGSLVHSLRGIYILTPRNMVQAAGFYNTMLQSDDPALIVECLNGYRLKEKLPDNIGEYTIPLGVPEIIHNGNDITVVTYGSCVRIASVANKLLLKKGIEIELIDVQTLVPFDLEHIIVESIKKTNRVLFLDEDVPGGGTSYLMQKVLEDQGAYEYLDSPPKSLTAKDHRTPYGTDGDYFCKPSPEDVYDYVLSMLEEAEPNRF